MTAGGRPRPAALVLALATLVLLLSVTAPSHAVVPTEPIHIPTRAERLAAQLRRARARIEALQDALAATRSSEPTPAATSTPASPAPSTSSSSGAGVPDWYATASCESGGGGPPVWDKGDGIGPDVTGGLQIATQTWLGYGGGAYASKAMYATPAQQIAIAEKVLAGQGPGAWPTCFRWK